MLLDKLQNFHLYLASQSPRRKELLQGMGIHFEILSTHVTEVYPEGLQPEEIVEYLSHLKLSTIQQDKYPDNSIFIACDTIVVLHNQILGKPKSKEEAVTMLQNLSGKEHRVMSGVTVLSPKGLQTAHRNTTVKFRTISDEEIHYYVNQYAPLDKAGAYGVQEWIGYVGIDYIEGSYYNVMGLPTKLLWEMLEKAVQ